MSKKKRTRKSNKKIDQRKRKNSFVDPYEIKGEENTSYLKEIAGLTALLGAGTVGATFMSTGHVKATVNSVDSRSQIVGSIAEHNENSGETNNSKSDQNDLSISLSDKLSQSTSKLHVSQSTSISLSHSLSDSLSISQSVLSSLSISASQSQSTSYLENKKDKNTSTSHVSHSTSKVNIGIRENSTGQTENQTSINNSKNYLSHNNSKNYLSQSELKNSNSLTNQINSLELGAITLTTLNGVSLTGKSTSDLKTTNSIDKNQLGASKIAKKLGVQVLAADPNSVDVSTTEDFYNQIHDGKSTATTINLTGDIDLGNYKTGLFGINDNIKIDNPRSITINGNGHTINFGTRYINTNWEKTSPQLVVTFKDANLYTASQYGSVWLDGPTLGNSSARLVYDDVNATGGTTVSGSTTTNGSTDGLRDFEIKGTTTITGVDSYDYNGKNYKTNWQSYNTNDKPLIATPYNTIIDSNANVTLDGGNVANNIIVSRGNIAAHTVTIGDNATVVMKNAIRGDITFPDWNTVKPTPGNIISIGKNANVTLETQGTNISLNGDQANNRQGMSGVSNLVTFGEGSTVTMTGETNFNVGSNTDATSVQINNPNRITLNNNGGQAYTAPKDSTPQYQFDLQNTNVEVVHKQADGSTVKDISPYIEHNNVYITPGTGTVNVGGGTILLPKQPGNVNAGQVISIEEEIPNKNAVTVIYNGYTEYDTSTSSSTSASFSTSQEESASTSKSNSIVESTSNSNSKSKSISESISNAVSVSESLSNSASLSESLSNSVSLSESLSNSVSMSESLSNSVSMSESLSNSVSMSESLSNSVSMSESLSNSVSMSESLSNSVSMSESLSNSVSMSESVSNSVSMSESLSNSVSMSESLSNSVSMSESLSNSVSMSESLSNSVSMSESLSNSVSMNSRSTSMGDPTSFSQPIYSLSGRTTSGSQSMNISNSGSLSISLSNETAPVHPQNSENSTASTITRGTHPQNSENSTASTITRGTNVGNIPRPHASIDTSTFGDRHSKVRPKRAKANNDRRRLPQTGARNSEAGLLGIIGATLGLLGLNRKNNHRKNK